ncbi:hypothetical protein MKZ20_08130 [Psychrobacillus sp. FSL K6-2684]|uniref:hypothetical protein n=1 Tax=Psychrobacillus sp. FSL K6-2684 TaxID=2921547 RepID=UPI0030F98A07
MLSLILSTSIPILISVFGGGIFLRKIIIHGVTENINQKNRKLIEEMKNEYAKNLEVVKKEHQIDIEKHKISLQSYLHFSDIQFSLYNKLWSSLCDLKNSADELWEEANENNLFMFISELKNTKNVIIKNSLILEEDHYKRLMKIIENFSSYQVGKERIIKLKKNSLIQQYVIKHINELTTSNRGNKENYEELMKEIAIIFKSHIYYPNPQLASLHSKI